MDANLRRVGLVMVNFMCQLDWIVKCQDIWLNVISGCASEGVSR